MRGENSGSVGIFIKELINIPLQLQLHKVNVSHVKLENDGKDLIGSDPDV
jgi:hypothetical protein